MIVRCSKCSTEFDLNPQQVGPEGVTLRCSVCEHMFHAEPNPDAGVHQPWQLCNSENHLFTLPDLATVISWIEDGQLRPDDQISRTGSHWLRLGDIPELSTVFIGFEGLPRVFKALATPPPVPVPGLGDLGPPPAFGESLGDIPAFGVGNSPGESQSMPASMLDAVTKAVSAPPKPPLPGGEGVVQKRRSHRSQPILVADLAGESVVATAISPEDSASGEVSAASGSSSDLGSSSGSGSGAAGAASSLAESSASSSESSASSSAESSASSSAESSASSSGVTPAAEGTPTASTPVAGLGLVAGIAAASEVSQATDAAEASTSAAEVQTHPPEEEEPEQKSNLGWLAIFGIAAGLAVMFGIPEIRAKILGTGGKVADEPTVQVATVQPSAKPADLSVATSALQSLSLEETSRAQATLQKMIDAREKRSEPVDDVKLAQVELILTRALALKASVSIDPTAVNGSARSRAEEDQRWAVDLIATIDEAGVTDKVRWGRTQGLLALAQGHLGEAANLVPAEAVELGLVVKAASLWQIKDGPVPTGLIGGLQGLSEPSTLARSLHALALWRSGDEEGAQKIVQAINASVPDQPLAQTLERALSAAIAAEREREEAAVEVADSGRGGGKVRKVRPPASANPESLAPAQLTPRGCQKVRSGDPTAGVKFLLEAIDSNAINLDTYLCLGEGYTKMDNLGSSLAFYDRATKVASKNKAALRGAAGVAAKLGRTKKAVGYYKRLIALAPDDEAAKSYLKANGADPDAGASGGAGTEKPEEPKKPKKPDGALMPVGG